MAEVIEVKAAQWKAYLRFMRRCKFQLATVAATVAEAFEELSPESFEAASSVNYVTDLLNDVAVRVDQLQDDAGRVWHQL